jgi:hypothetical protein
VFAGGTARLERLHVQETDRNGFEVLLVEGKKKAKRGAVRGARCAVRA